MSKELEELRARVAALEKAAEPKAERPRPQPIDWTAGMSMDRSAILAMAAVVGDRGMAEIVKEQARPVTLPSVSGEPVRGSGWREATPIGKRSELEDRIVDEITAKLVGGPNEPVK
jgi:hypothetical protein